ncbi:uncharacterized protein LOC100891977 [Strongylocentrotus purpuratus]|uniref:SRCR domain-containing protein n=1 Tax=Strongylocentrotus purpuratus TaxID=7668 RepID=A0A7M7GPC2_STRPU|nr:uncharacterized protein LOC100891977 [Strongylocentrotus purpuratus]
MVDYVRKGTNMALGCITRTSWFHLFSWVLLLNMMATGSGVSNWKIRLAGSLLSTEGRVEVLIDGRFGTITDFDTWGHNEARAVCNQLGFPDDNVASLGGGYYGQGSGPVYFLSVKCPEGASVLDNCTYVRENTENNHGFDAAVTCKAPIRLHGSKSSGRSMRGIIQLYNEKWLDLCTTIWTEAESEVACRQLGYSTGSAVRINNHETNLQFYQRDYRCIGDEEELEQCPSHRNNLRDCPSHIWFLTCSTEETATTPQNESTFTLSTISGSLVFLVLVIMVLLGYLFSIRKRASRHRRWITLSRGREGNQPSERERRMRRTRRVRGRSQGRSAPNVNSISNGQQGNDGDLPPYSRLEEEDTPPPYTQLPVPRIEIPVVGREERYEAQPPRCTETDAIDFFRELDAEQLRLQYENAAAERSPSRCGQQPPPDYFTATQLLQETPCSVNHQTDIDNASLAGSLCSDDEGDDISLSSCRSPIPVIPKHTVNLDSTVTSVEV